MQWQTKLRAVPYPQKLVENPEPDHCVFLEFAFLTDLTLDSSLFECLISFLPHMDLGRSLVANRVLSIFVTFVQFYAH